MGIHALGICVVVLHLDATLLVGAAAHANAGTGNCAATSANGRTATSTDRRAQPRAEHRANGRGTNCSVVGILCLPCHLTFRVLFAASLIVGELIE